MATGITKNGWVENTCIIPNENYYEDYSYEIAYPNKYSISQILQYQTKNAYIELFNNHQINKVFFGENLDVLSYLLFKMKEILLLIVLLDHALPLMWQIS
jgi:hypothetical protein